jgi:hypothetical protein
MERKTHVRARGKNGGVLALDDAGAWQRVHNVNVGMGRRERWERKGERQGAGSEGLHAGEDMIIKMTQFPRTRKEES